MRLGPGSEGVEELLLRTVGAVAAQAPLGLSYFFIHQINYTIAFRTQVQQATHQVPKVDAESMRDCQLLRDLHNVVVTQKISPYHQSINQSSAPSKKDPTFDWTRGQHARITSRPCSDFQLECQWCRALAPNKAVFPL